MVFLPLAMFNEPEAVSGSLQMGNIDQQIAVRR
jgi:hypothetical protein